MAKMNTNYLDKAKLLIKQPSKIKHIPAFLRQEFILWHGKSSASIGNITCNFVVTSLSEYNRVDNFKNEKDIIAQIMKEINQDDVFYDIGANIGTHSCFAGKSGAKVYSFEPFPENTESLKKNFELNNIEGKVFQVALMNEDSEMMLTEESGESGEGKISVTDEGDIKTQVFKGDNFIEKEGLEKPNVIKIDVEGAELEVLRGLEKTLEDKNLRSLFIEIHPNRIKENFSGSLEELKELLNEKNFEIESIGNRNREEHLKAVRK